MTIQPLFIGGCDRSGTTMLGDMLGVARNAFVTPESQFIHELILLLHQRAFSAPIDAADWLIGHFRFAVWDLDIDRADLATRIDLNSPRNTIVALLKHYVTQKIPHKSNATIWVDHTPDNMRYHGALKHVFPEARYLHIVRDGRAVFNSVKHLNWGPNNAYIGSRFWAERVQQALLVEILEGSHCLRIRYEDVLSHPEQTVRQASEHANLRYEEAMLEGGSLHLPSFTQNMHELVGRRPDPTRMAAWSKKLSMREIEEFEGYFWARTYLQTFGYSLLTDTPCSLSMPSIVARYIQNGTMYGINRFRHRTLEKKTTRSLSDRSLNGH